ncbi:hypothetical protein CROQUDRAFT_182905 [Cronartium quercuum f. sp. fusiforme G11]|uniref:Superkiller protein 3 n=1 Tax=Cronartium quercuum f. sp. fusiforme G11 TaxID=708437 RepID=A0A9P6NCM6_9BASI|nr:hypothetical protein CROQUDRAFT_182905 [Cronartium quercuum f. sp. fusiforme G11]
MSNLKAHLKIAREAISSKDWSRAESAAEAAIQIDNQSYHAYVFLGLARLNLKKLSTSQESYQLAIQIDSKQALAWQGLIQLYEISNDINGLLEAYENLATIWNEKQDAEKLGETLLKQISLPGKSRKQTISVLTHLLPDSPYYALLMTLPEPDPTNPKSSPLFELQLMIQNYLPSLKQIVELTKADEIELINQEISKRRTRLTSVPKTAIETKKEVIRESYPSSDLPNLWKQILNHPFADDETRREIEMNLLNYYLEWIEALPSPFKDEIADLSNNLHKDCSEVRQKMKDDKDKLRDEILELARGQVLLKFNNFKSWEILLDWNEIISPNQDDDPHGYLISLPEVFPNSDLTAILNSYHNFHLQSTTEEPLDEGQILDQMEAGFENAQTNSILSHFLVLSIYYELKDWSTIKLITENGLSKLKELEKLIGKRLTKAEMKFDIYLAISLTNLNPPTYHLRASPLIDKILLQEPNNGPILMSQAYIMKFGSRWSEAILYFSKALEFWPDQSIRDKLKAKSDKAWCLVELGQIENGIQNFEIIIKELDELIENDVEDEELRQDLAMNWYRLGRCNWSLYHPDHQPIDENMIEDDEKESLKGFAYSCFIKSIKASSGFAPPFTYLGLYYSEANDHARASKCFQKAFELDPTESIAAFKLATEFANEREWDLVEIVARRLISGGLEADGTGKNLSESTKSLQLASYQKHSWAWNAIGSAELSQGKYSLAINTFQRALRATPSDPHTWIKLGLAYKGAGKHVAALKSFIRARQLFDNENKSIDDQTGDSPSTNWFADFCIGDVQRRIGLIEPAIIAFEKIVNEQTDEVAVKIILAETKYMNALQYSNKGEFEKSELELIGSLDLVRQVFEMGNWSSHMRVGWKITSDVFLEFARWNKTIPISTLNIEGGHHDINEKLKMHISFYVNLAAKMGVDSQLSSVDSVTCLETSAIGAENGSSGLLLMSSIIASKVRVSLELSEAHDSTGCAQAWADLALTLGRLSRWLDLTSKSSSITDQSTFFKTQAGPELTLRQAIGCIRSALKIEPSNSSFWNTLGTLSFNLSPKLCQHALIKSVELNFKNYIGWTNLGFFYISQFDLELANQAFLKSQTFEPEWNLAWLGQALVSGLNEDLNVSIELIEHAFNLSQSNVTQIDLTYATIAFGKISGKDLNINQLDELMAPLLAVKKLIQRFPKDPTILNLYGILSEVLGKFDEACSSLEKAAEILEGVYEDTESTEVENRFAIVNLNLGRIRLRLGDYDGSIEAFEVVESLRSGFNQEDDKREDLEKIIMIRAQAASGIGLAKYFLGDIDSCIKIFKKILGELSSIDVTDSIESIKIIRRHISALAQLLSRILWSNETEEGKVEAREILAGVTTRNSRCKYYDLNVVMTLVAMSIMDQDDHLINDLLAMIKDEDTSRLPTQTMDRELDQPNDILDDQTNDVNRLSIRLALR